MKAYTPRESKIGFSPASSSPPLERIASALSPEDSACFIRPKSGAPRLAQSPIFESRGVYLKKLVENKTLPDTLLLYGPDHEALKKSAFSLLPENSLDLHIYAPESKNGMHIQATIEELIRETALPPFEAPFKLFVIEEAEKMLPSASNALLKTLEEPPEKTHIVLLSTHPKSLLPTIASRCHQIEISGSKHETSSEGFAHLLHLARNRDYPNLLKALDGELPEIELDVSFFAPQALAAERTYRLALERNIKPRTALLNFLFSL